MNYKIVNIEFPSKLENSKKKYSLKFTYLQDGKKHNK